MFRKLEVVGVGASTEEPIIILYDPVESPEPA
jgi:hypothetical protein